MAQVSKLMHAVMGALKSLFVFLILRFICKERQLRFCHRQNLNPRDTTRLVILFHKNSIMAKIWEKHTFSLRFLIDEEKNRVVLAEAGKDFVDVLCGILTLPMGTIASLLEKHKNPQSSIVGCFHNLHRSVSIMDDDNFQTQACKNLLMHPKSMKEAQCRQLKLNIER